MTSPALRGHVRRFLLWYLAGLFAIGTLVFLGQAISATASGNDPTLGAHPVHTTATVDDYDVNFCNRGGCYYNEKVSFADATGSSRSATIDNVDTRPEIGATLTVWYPAGNPSGAQTDGPQSAVYYWGISAISGVVTAVLALFVLRRRRRAT